MWPLIKNTNMDISLILAAAENNVIGKGNDLVWYLPADLKFFKSKTIGHNIIMGRNTFESIGGGRPLPKRITTIITRNKNFKAPEGVLVAHSLEQAFHQIENENEIFICGGAQIYDLALPKATKIYLTRVHAEFEGDTYFSGFNESEWELVSKDAHQPDEKNKYAYTFLEYKRKF